jgi:hypothetical protein
MRAIFAECNRACCLATTDFGDCSPSVFSMKDFFSVFL